MISSLALVGAYAIDLAFGEPKNAFHPVAWIGRAIAVGRDWALVPGPLGQLLRGGLVALSIPITAATLAFGALSAIGHRPVFTVLATALLLKPMFAVRGLRDAAFAVRDALDRGDIGAARRGLGSLCSREADGLDASALIAATVESVAENASDSIVAPLLFFGCLGLPGAVFYRSVNTLDAMMGYRGRFEYAGKIAARLDDALNLVPARLTAGLLLIAGLFVGADASAGLRVLRRDGGRTESPNAGRPMAAMAGLLGVCLEKPGHYALGDPRDDLGTCHITRAWTIARLASVLALLLTVLLLGVASWMH